jgi:MFS family permease
MPDPDTLVSAQPERARVRYLDRLMRSSSDRRDGCPAFAALGPCAVLSAIIGLILASAFSAILVFAQELVPGKVGTMSGLFFGLAFGLGGIGSAVLGAMADHHGIQFVFHVCSYLPLIGLLTALLPNLGTPRHRFVTESKE